MDSPSPDINGWSPEQKLLWVGMSLERDRILHEAIVEGRHILENAIVAAGEALDDAPQQEAVVHAAHCERLDVGFATHRDLAVDEMGADDQLSFLPVKEWVPDDGVGDFENEGQNGGGTGLADFGNDEVVTGDETNWNRMKAEQFEASVHMTAAEIALQIFNGLRPNIRNTDNAVDILKMAALRYLETDAGFQLCERKFKEGNRKGRPFFHETCPEYLHFRTRNLLDGTFTYMTALPR